MRSGQGGEGSFLLIDYFYPIHLLFYVYILTDFNYATLTSPNIFQKTVGCKLSLLR